MKINTRTNVYLIQEWSDFVFLLGICKIVCMSFEVLMHGNIGMQPDVVCSYERIPRCILFLDFFFFFFAGQSLGDFSPQLM